MGACAGQPGNSGKKPLDSVRPAETTNDDSMKKQSKD